MCVWLCLGGRAECACACVRVCAVFSRHPPLELEAPRGSLGGPDRCIVNPLMPESVPAGCGATGRVVDSGIRGHFFYSKCIFKMTYFFDSVVK